MALFDNVTFDFYKNELGRSEVPNEAAFNKFALENKLYVKSLIDSDLISEREENGFDSAVCLMIEEDYLNSKIESGETAVHTSESIGGYSYGVNSKAYEIACEKNARSVAEKKYKWLGLCCDILSGVR